MLGVSLFGLLLLPACAPPSIPAPESLSSPLVGRISAGSVLTIRPVVIPTNDSSFEMILAVLREAPVPQPSGAVEVLVRRRNGTVNSIVEPSNASASFPPGQGVSIVEAADTVLKPDENGEQR